MQKCPNHPSSRQCFGTFKSRLNWLIFGKIAKTSSTHFWLQHSFCRDVTWHLQLQMWSLIDSYLQLITLFCLAFTRVVSLVKKNSGGLVKDCIDVTVLAGNNYDNNSSPSHKAGIQFPDQIFHCLITTCYDSGHYFSFAII